jgi:hypothetical protein
LSFSSVFFVHNGIILFSLFFPSRYKWSVWLGKDKYFERRRRRRRRKSKNDET